MLHSLRVFSRDEVAVQRMKIIKFYEEYGEEATKDAFGADRKVMSRWRRRLKEAGGELSSLVPESTRPNRVRHSDVPQEVIDFIRDLRQRHPRLGKEKIKPLLDKYCKEHRIGTVSESTIGNIIKRHKLFFRRQAGYTIIPTPDGQRGRLRGIIDLRSNTPLSLKTLDI